MFNLLGFPTQPARSFLEIKLAIWYISKKFIGSSYSIGIHSPNIAHFPVSSTIVATTHMFNVFIGKRLATDVTLAQLGFLSNVEQPWRHQIVTLFTHCQVALNVLNFLKAQSGQFLIKSITVKICQLKSRGISCVFYWSPGHSKIPRNTEVDNWHN